MCRLFWSSIFHFKSHQAISQNLISECCLLFGNYGAPEDFSSDDDPQFTAHEFETFLKNWGSIIVPHQLVTPQLNGHAELAVKAAKQIIMGNLSPNGDLNNDKTAWAILQYQNTLLPEVGLSPAQLLFHRQLSDHLTTNPTHCMFHKQWLSSAEQH